MTFDYENLRLRYRTDAAFNKMTNLFRQLVEEYGFMPSEIRQSLFLAQYEFEINNIKQHIRTEKEWQQLEGLHHDMQKKIIDDYQELSSAFEERK